MNSGSSLFPLSSLLTFLFRDTHKEKNKVSIFNNKTNNKLFLGFPSPWGGGLSDMQKEPPYSFFFFPFFVRKKEPNLVGKDIQKENALVKVFEKFWKGRLFTWTRWKESDVFVSGFQLTAK